MVTTMKTKLRMILILIIANLMVACATMPTEDTQPQDKEVQLKTLNSAEEYLAEGKAVFNSGQYDNAYLYFERAIRLADSNQSAHLWAGTALTALGKGPEAIREFGAVVGISNNTPEAAKARQWLDRYRRPVEVTVMPFKVGSDKRQRDIESLCGNALVMYMLQSGLYSSKLSNDRRWVSDRARACLREGKEGASIVVFGIIDDYDFEKRRAIELFKLDRRDSFIYNLRISVTVQVYSAKDCHLITTFSKSGGLKEFKTVDIGDGAVAKKALDPFFQGVFAEINRALLW
jgi:tetratricopeptide (TPR) repeat protein